MLGVVQLSGGNIVLVGIVWLLIFFFFFKQKTAYEIGTGDWSSDVCSSDLSYWGRNRCGEVSDSSGCLLLRKP